MTPMDKGFSGGVILNEENQAIGLVITSEPKQATAIHHEQNSPLQSRVEGL